MHHLLLAVARPGHLLRRERRVEIGHLLGADRHSRCANVLLDVVSSQLPDSRVRDRIIELTSSPNESVAEVAAKFGSSGYVVESVPLALFAARLIERHPFDDLLRMVIEAGGDTDTNASMTGQVAGAWLGAAKISSKMVELLPEKNFVRQVSTDFAETLRGSRGK